MRASANCAYWEQRLPRCPRRNARSPGSRRRICRTRRRSRPPASTSRTSSSSPPARRAKRCGRPNRRCVRRPAARCSRGRAHQISRVAAPATGRRRQPRARRAVPPAAGARRNVVRGAAARSCKPGAASLPCASSNAAARRSTRRFCLALTCRRTRTRKQILVKSSCCGSRSISRACRSKRLR